MARYNVIHEFAKLRRLWFGGAGEFAFFNTKSMRNFCVDFRPIKKLWRRTGESEVWAAFVHTTCHNTIEPAYIKIGKYNFTTNDFSIYSAPPINKETLDLLLMSFDYVKKHVYHNQPFKVTAPWTFGYLAAEKCCRCGRPLVNPTTIVEGYGEECQRYLTKQLPVQLQLQKC